MSDTSSHCPVEQVALLLSDVWTMLIIRDLLHGPKRFCELEVSLQGISTRTLTNKLKRLEAEAIIIKSDKGGYSITEKGKGLRAIHTSMREYARRYLTK